jgi:predicted TIM-barrel fold metal-dependent hydrolase
VRGSRLVVDAHAHVIEHLAGFGRRGESRALGRGRVRWLDGEESRLIPEGWGDTGFGATQLLKVMDSHGVAMAILMQGSFYGFCNDYTREAQEAHPDRLFGMGTFDPYTWQSGSIMERLASVCHFRGLKFETSRGYGLMGYHPDFRLDGRLMEPVWEFAEKSGLVVSLDLGTFGEPSLQVGALAETARRHPDITFVVEHLFYPGPNRFAEVEQSLGRLAEIPSVMFTLAAIPNSTLPERYPFASACQYLAIARDTVGVSRLLWGSDLPSVAVHAPYRELIDWVEESGLFSDSELDAVYAGNAVRVYRLPVPSEQAVGRGRADV